MANFIGIEVSGIEKVYLALAELPQAIVDEGSDAILDYWRGVLRNPANYAPWRYVSRAEAYPGAPYKPGYFSAKQFRFVMAKMSEGYQPGAQNRTGTLAKGWMKAGTGEAGFLYNAEPYASFVIGDPGQAAQPKLVGWLTGDKPLDTPAHIKGAERALQKAAEKVIKRKMG